MKNFNTLYIAVKNLSIYAFERFLALIYKENCCICGCSKDNKILCKTCSESVEILSGFTHSLIDGVEIYSACIYKDTAKSLIHKLKFNHKRVAAKVLASFLSKYFKKILSYEQTKKGNIERFKNSIFIPVPTSRKNIRERGYNNVLEIVNEFAEIQNSDKNNCKVNILNDFLIKIKNTEPQYKMGKNKRQNNVKGAFCVNTKKYKKYHNKTIIVVDDIITTGATLSEIIKILKENNFNNIICITLSKAV